MRAVTVDRAAPGGLMLSSVDEPVPSASETLVRVAAISLNLGEVRRARAAADGWRPGWDFAGTVERAAGDGSGPPQGARVVGMRDEGAWAELVTVPSARLAALPASVTFERAATLPVAGLTALYALEKRGLLIERRVLITGASGGVGMFAMQLARLSGAHVTALVHREEKRALAAAHADAVRVGDGADLMGDAKTFDVILESVGGNVFANALRLLAADGLLVTYGTSADRNSTIEVAPFYVRGGAKVYGFYLFYELQRQPAGAGLARLAALLDAGKLDVHIDTVLPVAKIGEAVELLWNRAITGKLVVTF
jgi:NADPH:quinone reductase-like Zn-dependent oxidoreductase